LARDSDPVHGGRPAERVRRQILGDPTEEIGGWGIVIDSDGIPRVSTARWRGTRRLFRRRRTADRPRAPSSERGRIPPGRGRGRPRWTVW